VTQAGELAIEIAVRELLKGLLSTLV